MARGSRFSRVTSAGGDSIYLRVGRCGPTPHTLTLFKTKIADFPTLFKTEFRFLIPCLGRLTRNQKKKFCSSLVRRRDAQVAGCLSSKKRYRV